MGRVWGRGRARRLDFAVEAIGRHSAPCAPDFRRGVGGVQLKCVVHRRTSRRSTAKTVRGMWHCQDATLPEQSAHITHYRLSNDKIRPQRFSTCTASKAFADHLETYLSLGFNCCYTPPHGVTWTSP